jgi:hypothetical protein
LDCDVYLPRGFGKFVDANKLKARFDSGDWTFLVPFAGGTGLNVSFKLPDLKAVLPLSRLYLSAQNILAIEASIAKAQPLDFSIAFNDQLLGRGRIEPLPAISPSLVTWAQTLEHAWNVARYFAVEGTVEISVQSLARQNAQLVLTSDYIMPDPRRLKISTWIASADVKADAAWCVPLPTMIELGRYKVQIAAGLLGRLEPTGNEQNGMREYEFFSDSICRCFEEILTSTDGPGKSFDKLTAIVTEHHNESTNILHVEFAPQC